MVTAVWTALILFSARAGAGEEPAAVINGVPIPMSVFECYWREAERALLAEDPAALDSDDKRKKNRAAVLDSRIFDELLFQEATRRRINVKDRDLDKGEEEIKDRFRVDKHGNLRDAAAIEETLQRELQDIGASRSAFRENLRKGIAARRLREKAGKTDKDWSELIEALKQKAVIQRHPAIPAWDRAAELARLRRSAEGGEAQAQYELGHAYWQGQGVPQDAQESIKWFQAAARRGHGLAQYSMGSAFFNGFGVDKDQEKAIAWYRKAAQQGIALAEATLGDMFFIQGLYKPDYSQAMSWYLKAAGQGNSGAQNNLGAMHEHGTGVAQDQVAAYAWFMLAAAGGLPKGRENLIRLNGQLAAAQIAEAKGRARRLLTKVSASKEGKVRAESSEKEAARLLRAGEKSKAFDAYTKALSGPWSSDSASERVRSQYMKLLAAMPEPPAVPEKARRHSIRGRALIQKATEPQDFSKAVAELQQAVALAPWWVDAYYNLGLAHEGAGEIGDAIAGLKLYLLGNPRAQDAREVQDKIYALETQLEGEP